MADESYFSWAYAGVNNTLAGNGGPDCIAAVPALQRALETILFTTIGLLEIYVAYPHIRLQATPVVPSTMHRAGRRLLIAFMCLTFGIELGFKFATRQMIWILNPCHLVTMIQVYTCMCKLWPIMLIFNCIVVIIQPLAAIWNKPTFGGELRGSVSPSVIFVLIYFIVLVLVLPVICLPVSLILRSRWISNLLMKTCWWSA